MNGSAPSPAASARCACDRPGHHYGSVPCSAPAIKAPDSPGVCWGCYSAGHDKLSPCAPAGAKFDRHDS